MRVYFRAVWLPPVGNPDPFYVKPGAGRWPTDWTLYTATAPAVAWAEYCRNSVNSVAGADVTGGVGIDAAVLEALGATEISIAARSMYELDFSFQRLADLTSQWAMECLREAGFDADSFFADQPYGDCPALAGLASALNWEAMLVPSAAWRRPDGLCVPVFESGRARLLAQRRVLLAARPTVAVAVATHYPTGQRPSWLG